MSSDESDGLIDTPFEPENQILLRLPPNIANCLRTAMEFDSNLKYRLHIELYDDLRNGTLRFDGLTLPFRVVDLPTIIESLKTTDGKTLYKTGDLSQMMICEEPVNGSPKAQESKKKYSISHGITPPLKNVKSKRFRKTVMKKNIDLYEVEKEVRRLLKTDSEAVKVRYELIDIEDEKNNFKFSISANSSKFLDIEEQDLFGTLSSSEDEEICVKQIDPVNSSPINSTQIDSSNNDTLLIEDQIDETLDSYLPFNGQSTLSEIADLSLDAIDSENSYSLLSEESKEVLTKRIRTLSGEITELRSKIAIQEEAVKSIDNFFLKQRIINDISDMKSKEANLKNESLEIMQQLNG